MGPLAPKPSESKAGDECMSCAEHWDEKDKPRRKLKSIGFTQNHRLMVVVCPYCDGKRAIDLSKTKK